jgi:hypothetical protein
MLRAARSAAQHLTSGNIKETVLTGFLAAKNISCAISGNNMVNFQVASPTGFALVSQFYGAGRVEDCLLCARQGRKKGKTWLKVQ